MGNRAARPRLGPTIRSLDSRGYRHRRGAASAPKGVTQFQVLVRDNNVEQALRVLKKKMQREGVFREMKQRRFYEKPSERTTRERAEAVRRARKLARKKAQREGLIPSARPKRDAADRLRRTPPTFR